MNFLPVKILTIGLYLSANSGHAAKVIKLVGDPWCPFSCDPTAPNKGFVVDLVKQIFEAKGYVVTYESMTWARAIEETRENHFTALAGALFSDVPDFVFPNRAAATQRNCFYVKKGVKWKYKNIDSFKDIVIGIVKGYSYDPSLDEYFAKNSGNPERVEVVSGMGTALKLIRKVLDNRNDVLIEDESVVAYTLKSTADIKTDDLIVAGCLKRMSLHLAFSPNNPKSKLYAQIFSEGLKKLKSSNQLKLISDRYGIEYQ